MIMEILSLRLVCETFGVWSPYALSILGSIADRTTVRNGLPRKFARRQLLQQLSDFVEVQCENDTPPVFAYC